MLVRNVDALLGCELRHHSGIDVEITGERFGRIGRGLSLRPGDRIVDGSGLLLIPGLINAHTHVGDSIAKDVALEDSVEGRIHPVSGAKPRILNRTRPEQLASFMAGACKSMVSRGITTFVDFREGGIEGVALLRQALNSIPIRPVILGRLEFYQNGRRIRADEGLSAERRAELRRILGVCDGLGVSGANENGDSVLKYYSRYGKLRAIHCSETVQSVRTSRRRTGRSETVRALQMRPHFLVHMTHARRDELLLARHTRGIVVCPRANAALAEGVPDVGLMIRSGCNVAIGTDNVMINSPDMFREMDYIWKASVGIHSKRLDPREVLKMATVNAGKMLQMDIGVIASGKLADCVLIDRHSVDLMPMHDVYASIVHRTSESSIRAVIIGGRVAHGKA